MIKRIEDFILNNKKKFRVYVLLFVLGLPLFFINIRNTHDWGDDFATFIYQAKNITEGIPLSNHSFISDNDHLDGPAYIGFSIILTPVYYLFGNDIKAFSILITSILFVLCFALFSFFKKYFSNLISILLVMIFAYNPYLLNFKMEIMSDIPFLFMMMIIILVYYRINKDKIKSYILLGILAGILISIRNIGIAMIIAMVLDKIISIIRNINKVSNETLKGFIGIIVFLIASIGLYSLLYFIIFKIPISNLSGINHILNFNNILKLIVENIGFNITCFKNYFMSGITVIPVLPIITQYLFLVFITIGFINKCIKKIELIELIVICYLSILMLYPNTSLIIGMRYLLALFPFFLYYEARGLNLIKIKMPFNKNIIVLMLGLFVLIPYSFSISNIIKHQNETLKGPQEPESIEAFDYIKKNTPSTAIFAFFRARTMSLYADRKATYSWYWTHKDETTMQMDDRFKRMGVNYLLFNSDLKDTALEKFIQIYPEKTQLIWQNAKFRLYSLDN